MNIATKPPRPHKRLYPGYTLAQLQAAVKDGLGTPQIVEEIAARLDGRSSAFRTPQASWAKFR